MGGFTIEIFLAPSSDVLVTSDGSAGSYQISELQFRAELLSFNPAIDNAVNAAFRAGKIGIHAPGISFHVSGNSSMATIEIKMVHSSAISPEIFVYDSYTLCDRVITFLPSVPQITQRYVKFSLFKVQIKK